MRKIFLSLFLIGIPVTNFAQTKQTLQKNWKFTREDNSAFSQSTFNDVKWQNVTIPHDWAIYGPFDMENDIQRTAIKQDGQKDAIEHTGRTGGLPFVGVGWYRTTFDLPDFSNDKKVFIQFDGAMSNPEVFINGQKAGQWHNGYNTFFLDISNWVKNKNNSLAVRLDNLTQMSRWYPGAGLYRNVHIITKNKTHIPIWGVHITTPEIQSKFAKVDINTEFVSENIENIEVEIEIFNPKGEKVAQNKAKSSQYTSNNTINQQIFIDFPQLWDIKQPNLYKAITKLYKNGKLEDQTETTFGIRSIEVKPNDGFYLNGKKIKLKGVCLHHDLGALG